MTQTRQGEETAAPNKHPARRKRRSKPRFLAISAYIVAAFLGTQPAYSHPHVFVDGGIDFQFENGTLLKALGSDMAL